MLLKVQSLKFYLQTCNVITNENHRFKYLFSSQRDWDTLILYPCVCCRCSQLPSVPTNCPHVSYLCYLFCTRTKTVSSFHAQRMLLDNGSNGPTLILVAKCDFRLQPRRFILINNLSDHKQIYYRAEIWKWGNRITVDTYTTFHHYLRCYKSFQTHFSHPCDANGTNFLYCCYTRIITFTYCIT